MVISDTRHEAILKYNKSPGYQRRILASLFDFIIISPVAGLASAVYLKDLKKYVYEDHSSIEMGVTLILFIFVSVWSYVLIQSIFIKTQGATFGQRIFHLRYLVKNLDTDKWEFQGPHFFRIFFHQMSWIASILFLGVPLLDILIQKNGTSFYDRIFHFKLVCLDQDSQTKSQQNLFLQLKNLGINILTSFAIGGFALLTWGLVSLENLSSEAHWSFITRYQKNELCNEVPIAITDFSDRLDRGISMYLLGDISKSCLEAEADFILWSPGKKGKAEAYLAKMILSSKTEDQEYYKKKVCAFNAGELCEVSEFLFDSNTNRITRLSHTGLKLLLSKILMAQEAIRIQAYKKAVLSIEEIKNLKLDSDGVDKLYIKAMWKWQESKKSVRLPASEQNQNLNQNRNMNSEDGFEEMNTIFKKQLGIE